MLNHQEAAIAKGATMFNRIEWVAMDPFNNNVFFTETGRDYPGTRRDDADAAGAVHSPYHIQRAQELGFDSPNDPEYPDFYGRIWKYDPVNDVASVYLEGGPYFAESPEEADYPSVHLSNPDGLNVMQIDGKSYLVICEDLNGTSFGRVPAGVSNRTCELFLLDLTIENPTLNDLIRLSVFPAGSEVTGAMPTPDGKSLPVNVQHPRSDNPFPFNHSLTLAINGFDRISSAQLRKDAPEMMTNEADAPFTVYPNPTTRMVYLNKVTDVALYSAAGKRILVKRNTDNFEINGLNPGIYFLQNAEGETVKLSVQ